MASLRSAVTIPALWAVIGLLLFAGCSRPEAPKEAPKTEEPAPAPKALQEELPGTVVEVNGRKYVEADCDCTDEQDKTYPLDAFFDGAVKAPDLNKYVADHLRDVKPLCRKPKKEQSVKWTTKQDGYKFVITKIVNLADRQEEQIFDSKFPTEPGNEVRSGKMKTTIPYPEASGKCYVFKAYIRMYKTPTDYLDIDPHVGSSR
jgi:hypothetical protein